LKNDVYMYLQKVIRGKTSQKNYFFVGVLKVNDENSRAWNRGSGSVLKCHDCSSRHSSSDVVGEPPPPPVTLSAAAKRAAAKQQ
jgi:hypothetical protein